MIHNRHIVQGEAARSLYAHRFEQLVIIYFDADGLKRGFQLWLGWPGGTDRLNNCLPVYLAPDVAPPGLEGKLCGECCDALVLLCLAPDGSFSRENIGTLADVLQRNKAVRLGLVVSFATRRLCAAWRRRWPLPESFGFSLGSYTVSPVSGPSDKNEASSPLRYDLQAVLPGTHGSLRLPGSHARAPSANHGRVNP